MIDPTLARHLHEAAFRAAPVGMLAVGADGCVLLSNPDADRLLGYGEGTIVGLPAASLLPGIVHLESPESWPDAETLVTRLAVGRRRDGSEIPVEVSLRRVARDGHVSLIVALLDLRPRRQAEERFRAAVEAAPSGMALVDERGMIVLVNRELERLLGYPRQQLLGQSIDRLVPDAVRHAHARMRRSFLERPQHRAMGAGRELNARRRDGTHVRVEIGLNPIVTDVGNFVLASVVDISERRRLEEQVRQAHKLEALGTLAGGVAHDFNNVLLAIIGYTELAQAAARDGSRQREDLDLVLAAAQRGRQLVQRILTFSRRRDVARTPRLLHGILHEALQLLRASLPSTIVIREELDARSPEVLADEVEIHQLLMNLATNAAHAMKSGGTLSVVLEPITIDETFARQHPPLQPGPHARLVVADTGSGMPPEVLERAFEPFFTTRETGEGTGLGLSVVHGIVRSYEGAITIDSIPGRGTTVSVVLPTAAPQGAVEEQGPGHRTPSRPLRILLVEDEETLALLQGRQLRSLGFEVTVRTDSREAIQTLRAGVSAFDILITDNTMPGLSGIELTREARALRPDLPVLMVSGIGDVLEPDALKALGIGRVLPKPHTLAELAAAIHGVLAGEADR